jgi:hypothetical protein
MAEPSRASFSAELRAVLEAHRGASTSPGSADSLRSFYAVVLMHLMARQGVKVLHPAEQRLVADVITSAGVKPEHTPGEALAVLRRHLKETALPQEVHARVKQLLQQAIAEHGAAASSGQAFARFSGSAPDRRAPTLNDGTGVVGGPRVRHQLAEAVETKKLRSLR